MALDYSKLSTEELEAIANNDYSRLSESTLTAIAAEPEMPKEKTTAETTSAVTDLVRNAPMAAFNAPTGINPQAIGEVLSPLKQAIPQTIKTYAAAPYKAGVDLVVGAAGLPPPYAATEGARGLYNVYKGAQESMDVLGNRLSRPDFGPYQAGGAFPEAVTEYRNLRALAGKIDPAFANEMKVALETGGDRAVKQLLANAPDTLKNTPEFVAQANRFTSAMPTTAQQIGRVVGPALRGAARVAGPVGMGLNMYDAAQMARETELGSRLAQGQGGRAEQAFRGGPVQSYQGPQLSPQQAQNVLQSGSARDIQYFGGQDSLREQMRRKAAARVTGPVAPGQF